MTLQPGKDTQPVFVTNCRNTHFPGNNARLHETALFVNHNWFSKYLCPLQNPVAKYSQFSWFFLNVLD